MVDEQRSATGPIVPRVLVLLASHNGSAWIAEQLASIVRQVGVQLTLIVRDDASSDDTAAQVCDALRGVGNWTLERSREPSGSAAANFFALIVGCDATSQDYVAFADQDDMWDDDKLSRSVTALRASRADGFSSAVRAEWPGGHSKVLRQSSRIRRADFLFEGAGQGCTFVLTAAAFGKCQRLVNAHPDLLQNLHYHDWALYALLRNSGHRWHFDQTPGMTYRQHGSNDTGARSGAVGRRRRLQLIRSGWYAKQIDAVLTLLERADQRASGVVGRYRGLCRISSPWRRRIALAGFVVRHGRRRSTDRVVLAWAALRGYLA